MILPWRTLTQQFAGNNSNSKRQQWVGKQTTRPTINKLNKRQSSRRIYTKICKQMTNKWSQTTTAATTTRASAEQEQTETNVRGRRQQSKVRGVSTPVHTHANTHTHTQRENSWQFGKNAGITLAWNCLYQHGQLNRL